MTSKIINILQEMVKEKIISLESKSWYDDMLTERIIKYNQEIPKDKKKIAKTLALREKFRQQNILRLELSDEFK